MIFSDTTLRRPRTLFTIGLLTLCLTLLVSYERLWSTALGSLGSLPVAEDEIQVPGLPVTDAERHVYELLLAQIPSQQYGTSARPPLKAMPQVLVGDLPERHVPAVAAGAGSRGKDKDKGKGKGKDGPEARRLVIVGDVHGHRQALEGLLAKLKFDAGKGDHLVLTGDLVNKGPDSAGVVALAMELGAHAVRGNHEDRVLLAHAAMHRRPSDADAEAARAAFETFRVKEGPGHDGPEAADPVSALNAHQAAEAALSKGDRRDRETARSLTDEQVRWLSELPLILRIGPVPRAVAAAAAADDDDDDDDDDDEASASASSPHPPTFENLVVVHAGLVPDVPLERQDPWAVMNMRTITYPVDELRRDVVRTYLMEKAKREGAREGGGRGALAKLQAVDDAMINLEVEKMVTSQGLADRSRDAALPSSGRDGTYWYEEWGRYQERLAKKQKKADKKKAKNKKAGGEEEDQDESGGGVSEDEQRQPITAVVYGHDAKSGLRVPDEYGKGKKGYTFGLDSGCVYGRNLTALVIEVKKNKAVHEIVQFDCEKVADMS